MKKTYCAQRVWLFAAAVVFVCSPLAAMGGSATDWVLVVGPDPPDPGMGILIGAKPGWTDGYDGQTPFDVGANPGVDMLLYRPAGAGPEWSGPPGFYRHDYESPIPAGGSKTWWGIYLWSQDYTPYLGNRVSVTWGLGRYPPAGYWARLYIDYVPPECQWTGPWQFDLPLVISGSGHITLPVIRTSDAFQGTRLHLTVFTPEPSALAVLGLGLVGIGIGVRRRRE